MPTTNPMISLALPPELRDGLNRAAKAANMTVSAFVRSLIEKVVTPAKKSTKKKETAAAAPKKSAAKPDKTAPAAHVGEELEDDGRYGV